jgi:gamma-glutamylcyclotransferase (GGCT)/AIG2-like uncharacterized protein YtfP
MVYFAYGSNLHPLRLRKRVPSAKLVGGTDLRRYRLVFHKQGKDGSGKCHLISTGSDSDLVYGAIYEMDQAHKGDLDRIEGRGAGYLEHSMTLSLQGKEYGCFTYLAQASFIIDGLKPYHWYKHLVVLGARYLHFPDAYMYSIESVESVEDPDIKRTLEHETLIQKIIEYRDH